MQLLLDEVLAEMWPDGTFGGARTVRGVRSKIRAARPDPNAAEHVAELEAALHLQRKPAASRHP